MSRKLDAAIAEALGYRVVYSENDCDWLAWDGDSDSDWIVPCYSTDAEAMFELDYLMGERGWNKTVDSDIYGHVIVSYWNDDNVHQKAGYKKQQYLSAITAYVALTGKEWEGD